MILQKIWTRSIETSAYSICIFLNFRKSKDKDYGSTKVFYFFAKHEPYMGQSAIPIYKKNSLQRNLLNFLMERTSKW